MEDGQGTPSSFSLHLSWYICRWNLGDAVADLGMTRSREGGKGSLRIVEYRAFADALPAISR